jgi:ABC-type Fe3+ transport system substrate-binding protein
MACRAPSTAKPRKIFLSVLAALGSLVVTGHTATALTLEEIALLKGPDREKTLLEGAKTEGKVVLYSAMIVDQALRPLVAAFKAKYPFVDLEFWREDSTKILQKVLAERRANAQLVDIVEWGGGVPSAIQAGVITPFHSPSLDAYPKAYYDAQGRYAATRLGYYGMAFNTKIVPEADVPKTYEDLLAPKWRDKISWPISEQGSLEFIVHTMMHMGNERGEAYLKKLADQKLVAFTGSARALVDRVGQGEVPLAIQIYAHHPLISRAKGAPLDVQMMDPIPSDVSAIQLVKGAKHPHAAMLLIDFVLSKEGQIVLQKADYLPAHPEVDPQDSLRKIVPRLAKISENVISPLEFFDRRAKAVEIFEKYFDK